MFPFSSSSRFQSSGRHRGSPQAGHYYTLTRDIRTKKFKIVNDNQVHDIHFQQANIDMSYTMFYTEIQEGELDYRDEQEEQEKVMEQEAKISLEKVEQEAEELARELGRPRRSSKEAKLGGEMMMRVLEKLDRISLEPYMVDLRAKRKRLATRLNMLLDKLDTCEEGEKENGESEGRVEEEGVEMVKDKSGWRKVRSRKRWGGGKQKGRAVDRIVKEAGGKTRGRAGRVEEEGRRD